MEYFKVIEKTTCENILQEKINPQTLDLFTESMLFLEGNSTEFNGLTLWGEFQISYAKIKGGVRFTLLDCPNALAWTITTGYPPNKEAIILHVTINRIQKPQEFIEELDDFIKEWEEGLNRNF
ncbi:hypothetical protein [uncultured Lutibacter sp.]|uniref:hypothetical protein n=1 Tax=uncultured Lutibacter sp. TaxID=437739 RepID=UPI0026243021|nr:hypothetical protein [uncultured Lutibacter sp.]